MKKTVALFLAIMMCLLLCACGDGSGKTKGDDIENTKNEVAMESEVSDVITKEEVAKLVKSQINNHLGDYDCEMVFEDDTFYILIRNDDLSDAMLLLAEYPSLSGEIKEAYEGAEDGMNGITEAGKNVFDSAGYKECHVALGILDMTNGEDILFVSQDGETYYTVVD